MDKKHTSGSSGRYSEVRSILNSIQGKSVPDYQGLKAFWLDRETLLSAVLYGQRLVAPDIYAAPKSEDVDGSSCCGSNTSDTPPSSGCWPSGGARSTNVYVNNNSRSQQSALIKGLKGEAPFDGTIFERLLWNTERTAKTAEIVIIEKWIDDGCPDDDADEPQSTTLARVEAGRLLSLACGETKHSVATECTNKSQKSQKGLRIRKEIGSLTEVEVNRLADAIACMRTYDAYWLDERSFGFWGRMHANSCQHGWEQFLPWHRLYVYFFEQMLQDFDEHITVPYWAWSDYADANRNTNNTNQLDLGILPERFGCWLDQKGLDNLSNSGLLSEQQLATLRSMMNSGTVYQSGARFLKAAGIKFEIQANPDDGNAQWAPAIAAVFAELSRVNPLWIPQRWPGSIGSPNSYPTPQDLKNLLQTPNWADFAGGPEHDHYFGHLEQVHNGMHNFSGGLNPCFPTTQNTAWSKIYKTLGITPDPQNAANPATGYMVESRVTAFDPIFWAHHSNVDRLWADWQKLHPGGNPEVLDAVLAPWSLTVRDTLSTRKFGYEYMRNSYHYSTSRNHGMMKFNSEGAGVNAATLDNFSKAEIRLHRVQNANLQNAVIRIYLNDGKADENSKTIENDHFVGEVQTFHGSCYGGPGHCDLPLDKTRQFDQRGLHHKEPRNFRVDATESVNKMLAKGENDISVHLVAVGLDGRPIDNAVYLEGVSLNFMD